MRRERAVIVGLPVLLVLALVAGAAVAGLPGVVVVLQATAALAIVVVAGLRGAASFRRSRRPETDGESDGRRQWASLHRVESAAMLAQQSPRHYDLALRPRLQRVLFALAEGRRGIDLGVQPDRALDLVGADLWPLVDPDRPASQDGGPGGVDPAGLERLVDRIESL